MSKPLTLAEKLWNDHVVVKGENGAPDLLYIDLHLIHEVTSHKHLMDCDWLIEMSEEKI